MKNHLNVVLFSLIAAAGATLLAGCGPATASSANGSASGAPTTSAPASKKIGVVLIGDATEGYSAAHIDGINEAAAELGISDRLLYKYKVQEDDGCKTAIDDLVSEDCGLIISNSYGHQDYMAPAAKANKDVTFISMTGDYAAVSKISNFKNAFVSIYEARYVSGIVAGMKLKELADGNKLDTTFNQDGNGNWKIGYVGAYKYSEVVSGYTAFYLGVKSVISNVVMKVQFTNSWFDISGEGAAADALVKNGCVVIGQHADSTGAPAKVQSLLGTARADDATKKYVCYSVGFNIDMIPTAKDAALTSAINIWKVYYKYAFTQYLNGRTIDTDWCKGYADGAVGTSTLNTSCAAGTQAAVDTAVAAIKAGTLHVFNTANFTVGGKTLTSAIIDLSHYDYSTGSAQLVYEGDKVEAIKKDGDVSFFSESTLRSAPYFNVGVDSSFALIDVDGISVLS
ncbi:MAG: BMP family ABC transporter substrate-binding protein [Bacilli bacterium]